MRLEPELTLAARSLACCEMTAVRRGGTSKMVACSRSQRSSGVSLLAEDRLPTPQAPEAALRVGTATAGGGLRGAASGVETLIFRGMLERQAVSSERAQKVGCRRYRSQG